MPANPSLESLVHAVRSIVAPAHTKGVSDAELLRRHIEGDPTAFELLVWRHGGMVIRECRRGFLDEHETEDAFQAAFLVLARRSAHLCKGQRCVGGWLRTVARRIALNARKRLMATHMRERSGCDLSQIAHTIAQSSVLLQEIREVLYAEINRLPLKYREPLELRYFEQLQYDAIAAKLGISTSLAQCHVSRALEKVRRRLTCRGIALQASVLATVILAGTARSEVPAALAMAVAKTGAAVSAVQRSLEGLVSAKVAALAHTAQIAVTRTKVAVSLFCLFLVAGGGAGAGLCWQLGSKCVQDGSRLERQSQIDSNVLARQAAKKAENDWRQQVLDDVCVPRIIAAVERIAGKAELKKAIVQGNEAHLTLYWRVPFYRVQTVSLRYNLRTDDLVLWRDEGDGIPHFVEPSQPIYTELWRGGPKFVYGVAQVQEMHTAFRMLKTTVVSMPSTDPESQAQVRLSAAQSELQRRKGVERDPHLQRPHH